MNDLNEGIYNYIVIRQILKITVILLEYVRCRKAVLWAVERVIFNIAFSRVHYVFFR